jgi:hypothetical protein
MIINLISVINNNTTYNLQLTGNNLQGTTYKKSGSGSQPSQDSKDDGTRSVRCPQPPPRYHGLPEDLQRKQGSL